MSLWDILGVPCSTCTHGWCSAVPHCGSGPLAAHRTGLMAARARVLAAGRLPRHEAAWLAASLLAGLAARLAAVSSKG